MLGVTFYHQTIRKYVVGFGTLFNDINIERKNSSGTVIERVKVPLAYGPKHKFLTRLSEEGTIPRKVAIQLPRMGFEMSSINYDPTRKLNTVGINVKANTAGTLTTGSSGYMMKQYNPVPYTFDFTLWVMVKNAEDGTQILEQILPFFTPEFTMTINTISSMGIKTDIPVVLTGTSVEDNYEGDYATRRSIIWTLSFLLKGFIYPDIKQGSKIIKKTIIDFRLPGGTDELIDDTFNLLLEDSTDQTRTYFLLDSSDGTHDVGQKVVFEGAPETALGTDAGVKSRVTIDVPTTITATDDFGFNEDSDITKEFFEQSRIPDLASGGDLDD
jgi:hypothetical protein|tara:strand:- start:2431 stop:3414 length:984 start_codon:yes stop_codon:yes gene_type:complete